MILNQSILRNLLPTLFDQFMGRCSRICLIAFLALAFPQDGGLHAQDYDHYVPLECEGEVPENLRIQASKKYALELAALGDSASGKEGKARDNFLLQSNFVLEEMLLSGRVVFGDPVSEYVTRVKNFILRDQPELQKSIQIYLVKSPVVNAFATNSGVLLVNMGLIAHLKTEAELAFVLCHEIQHYLHKHPINNYVNNENLKSNAKLLGLNTANDYIAARTRYSRELELDADASGFDLYLKSGYSLAAAEGVFELLDYADQPFDQVPWDMSAFEWEYLRFPARFRKWPLSPIDVHEDDDDTLSTHPNIAKRRAIIMDRISKVPEDKGEAFMIGTGLFLAARKRCRFELCDLLLSDHAYEEAIYNCHLLQAEEPESHYLRKVIAQAFYGLVTYRNARRYWEAHQSSDKVSGEIQQLCYFMEVGDGQFTNLIAVHESWKTYLKDTTDRETKAVAFALLKQLFNKHLSTTESLDHEKPKTMPALIDSILQERMRVVQNPPEGTEEGEDSEEGDGNTLAARKENENYDFLKWSLTDLFENELFADAWATQAQAARTIEDEEYYTSAELQRMANRKGKAGLHLGIKKIVLVQPIYRRVDGRKDIAVQYLASESTLETYKETLAEAAKINGIEYEFLENRNLEAGDVQEFNDVSTMLLWFGDHVNGSDEKIKLVNFRQDEANALMERYGTKYFAWNGLIHVTDHMSDYYKFSWIMMGCVFLPVMPLAIYKVIKPINRTLFVTLVFDLEKSEAIWEDYQLLNSAGRPNKVTKVVQHKFQKMR